MKQTETIKKRKYVENKIVYMYLIVIFLTVHRKLFRIHVVFLEPISLRQTTQKRITGLQTHCLNMSVSRLSAEQKCVYLSGQNECKSKSKRNVDFILMFLIYFQAAHYKNINALRGAVQMTLRRRACFFGETQGLRSLTRTGIVTILMTTIMILPMPIASICSTLENGMIGPVLI